MINPLKNISHKLKNSSTHTMLIISIEEFNKIVERAAEKTWITKYKRLLKNNQRKSEAPWVKDEIRNEIKKKIKFTKKRETVMMLQKGNYILNRKKSYKLK